MVEAVQYDGENLSEIAAFVGGEAGIRDGQVFIRTLEGEMHASEGDWIIKGVKGEFYPCKSDIFEATYKRVAADGSGVPVSEVRGDEAP